MKPKVWHIWVAMICLFSGMLMAWQFQLSNASKALATERKGDSLISFIEDMEKSTADLEEEIGVLRSLIDDLQNKQVSGQDEMTNLQEELNLIKGLAGMVEVTGPGITIILDDNVAGAEAAKGQPGYKPERYIIHDKYVLYMVNEVKRAGAEAIAVNGQRIVTPSDIRCVGTVILVNSTRLAPPYIIQAIGNPEQLEQAILNGVEFPSLKAMDFPVKLTRESSITLPPYKGSYVQNHSQPVKEGR